MGAGSSSASKPLATVFGADKEGKRGPTLGGALVPGTEGGWRLILTAPLCIQVLDAHNAKPVALEDLAAETAMKDHVPFTSCSASDDRAENPLLSVGCQDGTIFVFSLANGTVSGPVHKLRANTVELEAEDAAVEEAAAQAEAVASTAAQEASPTKSGNPLAMSITVLQLCGSDALYAGAYGRCFYWDLRTGELQREFQLPVQGSGAGQAIPSTLAAVVGRASIEGRERTTHLWVGMDTGSIAIFDVASGALVQSFSCGSEALVSLAPFPSDNVVFALSAHRRVSVWDATTYSCIQKYPAELMTCGADLSAMIAVSVHDPELSLLMLAGVDGSLCVRRVSRRGDGKLNCVLLSFFECVSGDGAPITSLDYHSATDSVLVGDAGCTMAVLGKLKEQLGTAVQAHNEVSSARAHSGVGGAAPPTATPQVMPQAAGAPAGIATAAVQQQSQGQGGGGLPPDAAPLKEGSGNVEVASGSGTDLPAGAPPLQEP